MGCSKYLIQYPYESRPLPKIRRIDGLQSHPQNRIIGESPFLRTYLDP